MLIKYINKDINYYKFITCYLMDIWILFNLHTKYDALVRNVLSRGKCRDYGHISPSWQSFLLSSMIR